jgi:hypothetical protein
MKIKECLDKETVENLVLSHGTWKYLFYRCYAKKSPDYKNYGGRGIDVCHQWHGESGFYKFINDVGLRPSKEYSLDRIDVNKGYYPENVKWATNIEQANNRRNTKRYLLNGENLTISEISRKLNIPYKRLWKANKLYGSPLEHKKLDPNNGKYFYDGSYRSMSEIAKMVNFKPSTLMRRIRTGLDFDFAIATPLSSGVNLKERSKWS